MMTIIKRFMFDSAHFLPGHYKCGEMHGHTWTLKVSLQGEQDPDNGMVIDFHLVKDIVNEFVIDRLDHKCLNNLPYPFAQYPTCENLAKWIFETLQDKFNLYKVELIRIKLAETADNYVAYYGN